MAFFIEVLVGGLLAGVMYSLVALGFVLIFKASGVFNFAQGAMVLTAATTYAGLVDMGWSGWIAFLAALAVMIVFAPVLSPQFLFLDIESISAHALCLRVSSLVRIDG